MTLPRDVTVRLLSIVVLSATAVAGCADADSVGSAAGKAETVPGSDEGLFLDVLVIDQELVPVEEALVVLTPGPAFANTTALGRARFGPLTEGDYVVSVEKPGYASTQKELLVAQSPPDRMVITLTPVASTVPYHLTHSFMAYIFCTVTIGGTFAPCVPVNVLTGQNITEDRAEFNFRIPYPGLADMLHEAVWQASRRAST